MKVKNMEERVSDVNIESYSSLLSPLELIGKMPLTEEGTKRIIQYRREIQDILDKKDKRRIIITGPCSIHDEKSAIEYSEKLKQLAGEVKDQVLIVMRTYLEKPRSCLGWKGLVYDPDLNNSCDIEEGLKLSRKILLRINRIGLPCANEFVDNSCFPQYLSDLLSWVAIGARTTESPPHRELASGLSMPVGFKNTTAGEIKPAVEASKLARYPNNFLGVNKYGNLSNIKTKGNRYCHVILRGGNNGPNYFPENIDETMKLQEKLGVQKNIIIDCSHGNSNKEYNKQEQVSYDVLEQMKKNENIVGIMLESNIHEGKQPFPENQEQIKNLKYGVSITDGCINWKTTEKIIRKYAEELRNKN